MTPEHVLELARARNWAAAIWQERPGQRPAPREGFDATALAVGVGGTERDWVSFIKSASQQELDAVYSALLRGSDSGCVVK